MSAARSRSLTLRQAKYIPLSLEYFPRFPIANICFATPYARQFLQLPNVAFNMIQATYTSPWGRRFIEDAKLKDRQVYSWTVNDDKLMDWCIRKGIDAVCTDDPERFLRVCDNFDENQKPPWTWPVLFSMVRLNVIILIFAVFFRKRFGFSGSPSELLDKKK